MSFPGFTFLICFLLTLHLQRVKLFQCEDLHITLELSLPQGFALTQPELSSGVGEGGDGIGGVSL